MNVIVINAIADRAKVQRDVTRLEETAKRLADAATIARLDLADLDAFIARATAYDYEPAPDLHQVPQTEGDLARTTTAAEPVAVESPAAGETAVSSAPVQESHPDEIGGQGDEPPRDEGLPQRDGPELPAPQAKATMAEPAPEAQSAPPSDGVASRPSDGGGSVAPNSETHQRPSNNDEPSPEVGPQAESSQSQDTGVGTLAGREGRSTEEGASVSSSPPITKKERVRQVRVAHPDWGITQIAEHTGLTSGAVGAHLHALGMQLQRPGKPARRPAGAPPLPPRKAPTETEASPETQAASPFSEVDIGGDHRPVKKLVGKLFWLRDSDGRYLDRFCSGMTRNRKEAWAGNQAQLLGCRKNFAIARDLREVPVEKEGVRV